MSAAWTSAERFSWAHSVISGCLNPQRSHGMSIRGSMRSRMQRRLSSADSRGLFPVISHRALLRRCNISDSPRRRSVQYGTVTTDANAGDSSTRFSLRLSRRMIGRPVTNSAVIIFRTSSSFSGTVRPSAAKPVETMLIKLASSPLPEPWVGASIR